jgi:hypothetical protein
MTHEDFKDLQHGNVITDLHGNDFLVLNLQRGADGKVAHAGIMPAIGAEKAHCYKIKSKDYSVTYLAGRSVQAASE